MKIGLCLSGGGSKAFAHIGALKAFEEENIKFDCLSGTSSGSIVACLYSIGYSADEIYEIFKNNAKSIKYIDFKNLINIIVDFFRTGRISILGLNSGEKLYKLVKKYCNKKYITNINQIKIPLVIPAVNLCDEKLYVFSSKKINNIDNNYMYINDADIAAVVQSSCSYPRYF